MTCEVAILNARGIILAADSAGTVKRWHNNKQETRYFKGENKIFQLSYFQPVGLMTYANANLEKVPWELAVKEFRLSLDRTQYDSLDEYAHQMFKFLESNKELVPDDQRRDSLSGRMTTACINIAIEIMKEANIGDADSDEARTGKIYLSADLKVHQLEQSFEEGMISKKDVSLFYDEYAEQASDLLKKHPPYADMSTILLDKILIAGALNLARYYDYFSEQTGIVISGYGKRELFPRLLSYRTYGFIGDRFVYAQESDDAVSRNNASVAKSFASSEMIETFFTGSGPALFGLVNESFVKAATPLIADILNIPENHLPQESQEMISRARMNFSRAWFGSVLEQHYNNFTRVVGYLPIDEMAHLAETLINLEALKERVTRPSESVGGPVDVAAITKHEGFVWINRKHYFDLERNPRYWERLGGQRNARS